LDAVAAEKARGQVPGPDAHVVRLDIRSESSIAAAVDSASAKTGRLDILVNNAYPRTSDWGRKWEDIPAQSWRENVDMHMNGYFLGCRAAGEHMKARGGGAIINMGSIYGMVGPDFGIYEGTGITNPAAYAAIKGGILNLTRYLASYYGPAGVRVNSLSPGGVEDGQDPKFVAQYSRRCPLGRMATVEDITGGIVFLASDAARYVTGHNLVMDGGWTAI
jgi:NAD(P)-dependent dehydrogenase (short-subunit alcohol dehydrogenase family)